MTLAVNLSSEGFLITGAVSRISIASYSTQKPKFCTLWSHAPRSRTALSGTSPVEEPLNLQKLMEKADVHTKEELAPLQKAAASLQVVSL